MIIRRVTLFERSSVLVRLLIPSMREAGNLQWKDAYPNTDVFGSDIALGQLWVGDLDGHIGGIATITTDQPPGYVEVGWDVTEPAIGV